MADLFIDIRTGAYPRHPGDVELEPGDFWVEVQRSQPTEPAPEGFCYVEDTPQQVDEVYYQTWRLEPKAVIVNVTPMFGPRVRGKASLQAIYTCTFDRVIL